MTYRARLIYELLMMLKIKSNWLLSSPKMENISFTHEDIVSDLNFLLNDKAQSVWVLISKIAILPLDLMWTLRFLLNCDNVSTAPFVSSSPNNFRVQIELNDTWEEVKCTKKNVSLKSLLYTYMYLRSIRVTTSKHKYLVASIFACNFSFHVILTSKNYQNSHFRLQKSMMAMKIESSHETDWKNRKWNTTIAWRSHQRKGEC